MRVATQTVSLESLTSKVKIRTTDTETERVERYAGLYTEKGASGLPPIKVMADDGGKKLLDGVNRVEAARAAGFTELPAEVFTPDQGEDPAALALLIAVRSVGESGRNFTTKEKREAIGRLIEVETRIHPGGLSDRAIGREVGCSGKTVKAVRQEAMRKLRTTAPSPEALAQRRAKSLSRKIALAFAELADIPEDADGAGPDWWIAHAFYAAPGDARDQIGAAIDLLYAALAQWDDAEVVTA